MRQTIETDKDQLVICRTGENQDPSIHWYKYKEEKPIENSKKNIEHSFMHFLRIS